MIKIVYGKSRSGKTSYLYNMIKEKYEYNIENNINSYLIVPEQFSLSVEERLSKSLSRNGLFNIEVLTFKRLAYKVLKDLNITNEYINDIGKKVIIYNILKSNKYKTFNSLNKGNIENLVDIFDEFERYNVDVNEVKKISFENEKSQNKVNDLIGIYDEYLYSISQSGKCVNNELNQLLENFDKSNMFVNTCIYIDEFFGYTKQEYDIILKLAQKSNIYITFCIDDVNVSDNELDIYAANKKEYINFIQYCNNKNIDIEDKINIDEKIKCSSDEIVHLTNNIFSYPYDKYSKECKNIYIYSCINAFTEIENLAIQISNDIKKGYRYSDIAVITRDVTKYDDLIWAVFSKYNIPYFIDTKNDINNNQISQLIFSLLNIVIENFSYESMFSYLKSNFLDVDIDDIFLLENYCVKWGIKGYKWLSEFKYGINDNNSDEIKKLNVLRNIIIPPLLSLKQDLSKANTANDYVECIYKFLNDSGIQKAIEQKIELLKYNNQVSLEMEYRNIWNYYVDTFKQLNISLNNIEMNLVEFKKILEIALTNMQKGYIPLFKDEIIIGDIDRTRTNELKKIYFIGTQNDKFPIVYSNEGILNDNERVVLSENDISVAKTTKQKMLEDQFNIYKIISMSKEQIVFSYILNNLQGISYRPSFLINKIKNIFNIKDVVVDEDYIYSNTGYISNSNFIHYFDNIEVLKWAQKYNPKMYEKFLNIINYENSMTIALSEENCNILYGSELKTSISRIEKYAKCPYSFYLEYGLKIRESEKYKVRSLDIGNFNHQILDEFFKYLAEKNIDIGSLEKEKCSEITQKIVDETFNNIKIEMIKNAKEFAVLKMEFTRILKRVTWILVLQIKNSSFRPIGTEVDFGSDASANKMILELDNGKTVTLVGKIDRIDIANTDKGKYVRIIDYKSSNKDIDVSDIYNGINIQLITYLDTVIKNDKGIPGGIFYFKVHDPLLSGKNLTSEEIENQLMMQMRLNGLVLKDEHLLNCMDKNLVGSSTLINVKINKNGEIGIKNAISIDNFKKLQKESRNVLRKISNQIMSGKIDVLPYWKNKLQNGCMYCPYNSICKFNAKDTKCKYNILKKVEF